MGLGQMFGGLGFAPQPVAAGTEPPLAGTLDHTQIYKDAANRLGIDLKDVFGSGKDDDPMSRALKVQIFQDIINNDPRILEERSRIYEGTMGRLFDKAQQRSMQGHVFKGFMDLPGNWQKAMAQKFTFAEPTINLIGQARERPAMVARQYINL
jgi:hypothetical protein